MKLLALCLAFALFPSSADAHAEWRSTVDCSTITETNGAAFEACATLAYFTPSPVIENIETNNCMDFDNCTYVLQGGFRNEYTVTTGLKEGLDTFSLSEEEQMKAFSNGVLVVAERDDFDKCSVSVTVKSDLKTCSSCTYCGQNRYSADCTNLKNGRNVTCESIELGDVFFPLTSAALATSTKAPTAAPVAAPTKAPKQVRAPRAPVKAAPRAPVKAPVRAPIKPTKPVPVPVKPPKNIRAPVQKPVQKPVAY